MDDGVHVVQLERLGEALTGQNRFMPMNLQLTHHGAADVPSGTGHQNSHELTLKVDGDCADNTRVSYPHRAMHTSIAGLLHDHAVLEFKRQEFLRNVAEIVGAAPAPQSAELTAPLPSINPKRSFLNRVDQVLRDAARSR
ncbi:hypothetical protein LX88_001216 [Lentzea californiensis]|nr:hypothetical protein [Lentzea californiensis]